MSANSTGAKRATVESVDGYTPIAAIYKGSGGGEFLAYYTELSGTTARMDLKNITTASQTKTPSMYIVYSKN